ncbi:MAG: response regulator [Hyphomonadaceae bacterium]
MGHSIEWGARTRRQEDRLPLRGSACVVEPDDIDRDELASQLRRMGFAAHETGCGALGAMIADQIRLNLIVVNVMTHDTSGLRLIQCLRGKAPNAAIVALTPNINSSLPLVLAREAGADAVLGAPAGVDALCEAVTQALKAHGFHE